MKVKYRGEKYESVQDLLASGEIDVDTIDEEEIARGQDYDPDRYITITDHGTARWYAVQVGDCSDSDDGSFYYEDALKRAEEYHEMYPGEEIRIVYCSHCDDFAEDVDIIYEGEYTYEDDDREYDTYEYDF